MERRRSPKLRTSEYRFTQATARRLQRPLYSWTLWVVTPKKRSDLGFSGALNLMSVSRLRDEVSVTWQVLGFGSPRRFGHSGTCAIDPARSSCS
eukprot:1176410-Prymnesium_polylepis.1